MGGRGCNRLARAASARLHVALRRVALRVGNGQHGEAAAQQVCGARRSEKAASAAVARRGCLGAQEMVEGNACWLITTVGGTAGATAQPSEKQERGGGGGRRAAVGVAPLRTCPAARLRAQRRRRLTYVGVCTAAGGRAQAGQTREELMSTELWYRKKSGSIPSLCSPNAQPLSTSLNSPSNWPDWRDGDEERDTHGWAGATEQPTNEPPPDTIIP